MIMNMILDVLYLLLFFPHEGFSFNEFCECIPHCHNNDKPANICYVDSLFITVHIY